MWENKTHRPPAIFNYHGPFSKQTVILLNLSLASWFSSLWLLVTHIFLPSHVFIINRMSQSLHEVSWNTPKYQPVTSSHWLSRAYYSLGNGLVVLHIWTHLSLIAILWGGCYDYPVLQNEKARARERQSQGWELGEWLQNHILKRYVYTASLPSHSIFGKEHLVFTPKARTAGR